MALTVVCAVTSMMSTQRRLSRVRRAAQQARRLHQTGRPASGRVVAIRRRPMTMNLGMDRRVLVTVDLDVDAVGSPGYRVQQTTMIPELQVPSLAPGAAVQLRIDPANPTTVAMTAVSPGPIAPSLVSGRTSARATARATPIIPPSIPRGVQLIVWFAVFAVIASMGLMAWLVLEPGLMAPSPATARAP